jgi:hypothetical protein
MSPIGGPEARAGVPGDLPAGGQTAASNEQALPEQSGARPRRQPVLQALIGQVRSLVRAIDAGDERSVGLAVHELSRSRRYLAPLALTVGAFVLLFQGLRLLVANWRLTLIQVVPAMWIWAVTLDLRLHVLEGREMRNWHGAPALSAVIAIILITTASFYLNAVFAFAISRPGRPDIRPAFSEARRRLGVVVASGFTVGAALGTSAIIVPRWGRFWFAVSLSIVVGVMMFTYVTVPSRMVGIKTQASRRDKFVAAALGGAVGAIVCTPPYTLARIGILLLGWHVTFAIGVILIAFGLTLQAGASGAINAIKISTRLVTGHNSATLVDAASSASGSAAATDAPKGSSPRSG